jgi:hypothetical protein
MRYFINRSVKPWISMHYRNLQLRLKKKKEVSAWEQPLCQLPQPSSLKVLTKYGFRVQIFSVRYYVEDDKHIVAFITNPHEKDWGCRVFNGSVEGHPLKTISRFTEAGCKVYRYEFQSCPDVVSFIGIPWLPRKVIKVRKPYKGPSENIISTLCFERLDLLRDWVQWHKEKGYTMFLIYVNHDSLPQSVFNDVNSLGVEVNWMSWSFPYHHRTRIWPKRDMHWAQPAQMVDALLHLNRVRKGYFTIIDTDEFIYSSELSPNDNKQELGLSQVENRNVWATLPDYTPWRLYYDIKKARIFDASSSKGDIELWTSEGITRFIANPKQRGKSTVKLPVFFHEIPLPHQILPSQECPLSENSILLHFADIAGKRRFGSDVPWRNLPRTKPTKMEDDSCE